MQTIETETNQIHLGIVNLYGFMETGLLSLLLCFIIVVVHEYER